MIIASFLYNVAYLLYKESLMFSFLTNSKNAESAQIIYSKIPASNLTPLMVTQALNAPILLESAHLEQGKGRFSIIIAKEAFRILKQDSTLFLKTENKEFKLESKNDFLKALESFINLSPTPDAELSGIPLPLGGVGYLGYEFFSEIEKIEFKKKPLYEAPECAFIFGREFIVFDHFYDLIYIVCASYEKEANKQNLESCLKNLESCLKNINTQDKKSQKSNSKIISKDNKNYYKNIVKIIKDEIYKGNLLQCVPSQSMHIKSSLPPLLAYQNLRIKNPSPYMYYLDFKEFQIIGASPEVLVKVKENKENIATLTIRPIAGTRARGKNALEDSALEAELKANEKENAEHLMLLDLGRNDIGKVAKPNSIKVTQEKIVEKYARVMHLVSEVRGEMDLKEHSKLDALKASFPAGTVSGAPKIQAIKTIESLEEHKRGIYSGAIGYFSHNLDMDFAIAIRTAVFKDGIYYLQAGAGVVYDSDEEAEFIETQNKMLALKEAILGE